MPRVSYALLSSSSDDAVASCGGQLQDGEWTVLHLRSMESIPFSEVSHTGYGQESTYLNSTTHAKLDAVTEDTLQACSTPGWVEQQLGSRDVVQVEVNGTEPETAWRPLHLTPMADAVTCESSMVVLEVNPTSQLHKNLSEHDGGTKGDVALARGDVNATLPRRGSSPHVTPPHHTALLPPLRSNPQPRIDAPPAPWCGGVEWSDDGRARGTNGVDGGVSQRRLSRPAVSALDPTQLRSRAVPARATRPHRTPQRRASSHRVPAFAAVVTGGVREPTSDPGRAPSTATPSALPSAAPPPQSPPSDRFVRVTQSTPSANSPQRRDRNTSPSLHIGLPDVTHDNTVSSSVPHLARRPTAVPGPRDDGDDTDVRNRLVALVQAVSDVAVLHVIHDYAVEREPGPGYAAVVRVCAELLAHPERLRCDTGAETDGEVVHDEMRSRVAVVQPKTSQRHHRDNTELTSTSLTSLEDEFDEADLSDTPYPCVRGFRFAEPSVSGIVTRVFRDGMLYRIKDANHNYYFFNDTLREIMMVRIRRVMTGDERVNPAASQVDVGPSHTRGDTSAKPSTVEREITIAVRPETTTFLIGGVRSLPHVMAKAVRAPAELVAPSVLQCAERVNAGVAAVRALLRPWERANDQRTFLQTCLRHGVKFTDLTFRPATTSLCRTECDVVRLAALTWRRPEEYLCPSEVSNARLFRRAISCHLVRQGELSDHTVVAAIAALARHPAHILWLFRHPVSALLGRRERAVGAYRVQMLHNGWWHTVLLDDYVPASLHGPLFARCPDDPRRLWVSLLEKAYAKSVGSYAALCTEDVLDVLCNLTGFVARGLDAQWAAAARDLAVHPAPAIALFDTLQRAVRRGCTVLLFTPPAGDGRTSAVAEPGRRRDARATHGVVPPFLPGHVYFLCDAAHYTELDLRLVRLQNPWTWESAQQPSKEGERRWRYTAWYTRPEMNLSMSSTHLSTSTTGVPVERAFSGACTTAANGGTMWMEWNEALHTFGGAGVCYTLWDWHRYRVRGVFAAAPPHAPQLVLELRTCIAVEVVVGVMLEEMEDRVDLDGNVVDTRRRVRRRGVGLAVAQRTRPGGAEVRVRWRAGADVEAPTVCSGTATTSSNFVRAREVALTTPLTASTTPYYLLPTLEPDDGTDGTTVPYVVSLLLSAPVQPGKLEVHFRDLDPSCAFLRGAECFTLGRGKPVRASFQHPQYRGVRTAEGTSLEVGGAGATG